MVYTTSHSAIVTVRTQISYRVRHSTEGMVSFNTYVLCFEAAAVLSEDMADQVRPEYCRCMRWKEGPKKGV